MEFSENTNGPTPFPVCPTSIIRFHFGAEVGPLWRRRPSSPASASWGRALTNVAPSRSPRIHSHNHSMLELEGEGGSAMGHLNLNVPCSVPTQGLEEFSGLVREKRQRKGR